MPEILTEYFRMLTTNLLSTLNTPDAYLNKIALSAITIIISLIIHILFKNIITTNTKSVQRRYNLKRVLKNSMLVLTIILVLFIWIKAINALVLIALLGGAIAIIMLRGLTLNIIGYFIIKYRRYFKIGYRVEINDIIGDVIDINPVSFKLLEVRNWLSSDSNTGRTIQVPNSIIFDESIEIIDLTNTFIWHEIKYTLSFDSNWKEAEEIMTSAGDSYFKEKVIPNLKESNTYLSNDEEKLQPVFSLNTDELGIVVNLRYLVDYRNGTSTKTYLQRDILSKFEENPDIKFAVSDIRILSN